MNNSQPGLQTEALTELSDLTDLALRLAKIEGENRHSGSAELAQDLVRVHFWKSTAHLYSIRRLLVQCCEARVLWDVSGVAALTRSIIDAALGLAYWRDRSVVGEQAAKIRLHMLHEKNREHQLLLTIGSESRAEVDARARFVDEARGGIESDPLFQPGGQFASRRKEALKGDLPRLLKNDEIAQRAQWNVGFYDTMWRMLSSHVHAHPHAISWLSSFSARNPDSARLVATFVRFATICGSWTALEFEKEFTAASAGFEANVRETMEAKASMIQMDLASL